MNPNDLDQLKTIFPFLIPVLLISWGLVIAALLDLIKREKTNGPKWMWVLVILLINFIGPIVYFFVGRDE